MTKRQAVAALALAGVFLSAYLTLYKLGMIGTLACGTGGCETVQLSKWGDFLGLPVAAWGVGFYFVLFALATAAEFLEWPDRVTVARWLTILTGWGVIFSGWLTWLEVARIHAICRYCVVSALLVLLLFVLSLLEWRAARSASD